MNTTQIYLLPTHFVCLLAHMFSQNLQFLTFILTNATVFWFYLTINKKRAKKSFYNFSIRTIKYYGIILCLLLVIKYLPDSFKDKTIYFTIFYIISDFCRIFIHEYTQYIYFTKMISPYQNLIMKFEVIMQFAKSKRQMKASNIKIFDNETDLFDFFMKNYEKDVLDQKTLFDIFVGKKKLEKTDQCVVPIKENDRDSYVISSDSEANYMYDDDFLDNSGVNQREDATMVEVLSDLSAFTDLFPDASNNNQNIVSDELNHNTIKINFPNETISKIIFNLFKHYDKVAIVERNFGDYYNQYLRERTGLYNSINNCYKLFKIYNYTMISFQIIILATVTMISLSIEQRILSMSLAIFSFALFPSLVNMIENFIMLILNHPFDCGDRIFFKNENYVVKNINLFFTIFEKWNGEFVIIDNTLIGKEVIQNVKRSNQMSWPIVVYVHKDTKNEDIFIVINMFKYFCKQYVGRCITYIEEIEGMYTKYSFIVNHGVNFQNGYFMWRIHNKYMLYLKELLDKHKITYILPRIDVNLKKESQA